MKYMAGEEQFLVEITQEILVQETWIPWSSQRMTNFYRVSCERQKRNIIATQSLKAGRPTCRLMEL